MCVVVPMYYVHDMCWCVMCVGVVCDVWVRCVICVGADVMCVGAVCDACWGGA